METKTLEATPETSSLPPILQQEIDRLFRRMDRIRALAPSVAVAEKIKARFSECFSFDNIDAFDHNEVNLFFRFKTMAQAVEVLRVLAEEEGLHLKGKPSKSDSGDNYYWRVPGLCICGNFSSTEADACKLVQVGVKEVPVYELRCGGAPVHTPDEPIAVMA